jgi:16S rRNA (guanine966-N2)-methyltransferase
MLRITGGEFRGRVIHTLEGDKTRPTQARLRQAIFNSIQSHISEARVLDLFAGSGALGFEALSRGASHVVFVESARSSLKLVVKNIAELGVDKRTSVIGEPIDRAQPRIKHFAPFDLILADPPYAEGWEERLLREFQWDLLLKPGGYFCLEWGRLKSRVGELPDSFPFLVKIREKTYGDTVLTTYVRSEEQNL